MTKAPLNPFLKLVLEVGPLVVFFAVNARANIFAGTAAFMATIVACLAVSYTLTRRLPIMAIVSGVVVLVFGSLTLLLHNDLFIKVKPTIIYTLFGGALISGLIFNKPLLAVVLDQVFHLTEEGWRKLTLRWAWFFFGMAVLNELVWRTQSTEIWLSFKLFGAIPLTFLFAASQYPLLKKHEAAGPTQDHF